MPFTHTFEIKYDSKTLEGEIEFNTDSKVTYSFTNDPTLELEESQIINHLFEMVQTLFKIQEGLDKIEIIKK